MAPPPSPSLIGPPELYVTKPSSSPNSVDGDPFMDLMVEKFNCSTLPGRLPRGFTVSQSPTFLSSGNPCLDFFFHVVPNTTSPDSLTDRLSKAWEHNPLTTLKLVCNLRGVGGTGKSDREGFLTAALWLHSHYPKSLACNIRSVAEFGIFEDLPEILYRLLEGPDVRRIEREERLNRKGLKSNVRGFGFRLYRYSRGRKSRRRINSSAMKEIRMSEAKERAEMEKERAKALREEEIIAKAKKVIERYEWDFNFQFLHEKISDHFAECLKADLELLKRNECEKISLAAKSCPSLDSSFDRSTLLCESIAKKVFPRESYPEYEGIEEAHYVYRVRDRLRKEVLVPLRKALEMAEIYMAEKQWKSIRYDRVDSLSMKRHKEKFLKRDGERFIKYLNDVNAGKVEIAAEDLFPHEIIESLNDRDEGLVAELQWKRMVDDLSKSGRFRNCLAVCDVSGNMKGKAMEVSLAIGLLVSELSEDPWKGKVITFSKNPELHLIKGNDLQSKIEFVRSMEWGGESANIRAVFDLILDVAARGNLKEEQMIKRVFVFSDMEFDQDSSVKWETDYDIIVRSFSERGYGKAVPEIVFWNLRDSPSTPVPSTQKGVALVSGFSKNLLKIFLDNNGEITPEGAMEAAISGEEYNRLVSHVLPKGSGRSCWGEYDYGFRRRRRRGRGRGRGRGLRGR